MSNCNSSSSSAGIGFPGLLAIVFITLKLCGVITWSWWWVTCPLWIPLCLVLFIVLGIGLGFLAYYAVGKTIKFLNL